MEKYGEDPAVKAPPKKDAPASDSNTEAPKKKVMDPKKQALLEKRKKYDPRAAIKNSKKILFCVFLHPKITIKKITRNGQKGYEKQDMLPIKNILKN